jgi:uncharacterized membrane protein YebE (DUF533 family)
MADYTYLMNVPAARIHKHSARETLENAEESIYLYWLALIVMAASPGPVDEEQRAGVINEIQSLRTELEDAIIQRFLAQYIVENPNECIDELCNEDEGKSLYGENSADN